MAGASAVSQRDRFVLDAGAVIAISRGDVRARAFLEFALEEDYLVLVPTPVVAQVHRGGRDHARTDRVLLSVDKFLPTSVSIARRAGELLGRAGHSDAVDAIVVAEALAGGTAAIVTSDPDDIADLVDAGGGASRVSVLRV